MILVLLLCAAAAVVAAIVATAVIWRIHDVRTGARLDRLATAGTMRRVDQVDLHQLDDDVPTRLAAAWGDVDVDDPTGEDAP
ncbi:MAG: hypothetical protein AAGA90_07810 [Actinomycetota bacterium]